MYYVIRNTVTNLIHLREGGFLGVIDELVEKSENLEYLRKYCKKNHAGYLDITDSEQGQGQVALEKV